MSPLNVIKLFINIDAVTGTDPQIKPETKSITSKAMQYRQDIATQTPITRVELITISIVTIRSIWHNSAADFLRFGIFPPQICESCGATYRWNYETFRAL